MLAANIFQLLLKLDRPMFNLYEDCWRSLWFLFGCHCWLDTHANYFSCTNRLMGFGLVNYCFGLWEEKIFFLFPFFPPYPLICGILCSVSNGQCKFSFCLHRDSCLYNWRTGIAISCIPIWTQKSGSWKFWSSWIGNWGVLSFQVQFLKGHVGYGGDSGDRGEPNIALIKLT